jgi:hypothetical protein
MLDVWNETNAGKGKTSKRTSKSGSKIPLDGLKGGSKSHASYNRNVRDVNGNVGEGTYLYSNVPSPKVIHVPTLLYYVASTVLVWNIRYRQRNIGGRVHNVQVWASVDTFACYTANVPVYGADVVLPATRYARDANGHGTYLLSGKVPYAGTNRADAKQNLERLRDPSYFASGGALLAALRLDLSEERAAVVMRRKLRKSAYRKSIALKREAAKQLKLDRIARDERRRIANADRIYSKFLLSQPAA